MTTGPDVDQAQAAAAQLDPDAQLDLLARELERREGEREAAAKRKAAAGGPCRYCGTVESWKRPGVGRWHHDSTGPVCMPCWRDLGLAGPGAGSNREARAAAARLVLGDTPAPPWAGHGTSPAARWWHDGYLADAMAWWYEVPGARPGHGAERFGYLTGPELVARLYQGREPKPTTLHSRGRRHRCPSCGAKGEVWTVEQVGVSAAVASDGGLSRAAPPHFRITWTCHGRGGTCRHTDVEQRPQQLDGVPVAGLVG